LKAGKVVSAKSGAYSGVAAIGRMLRCPPESRFVVHRLPGEVGEQHLGSLAQILINLGDASDHDWAEDPPTPPHQEAVAPRPSAPPRPVALDDEGHADRGTGSRRILESQVSQVRKPSPSVRPAADVPVVVVTSPKGGSGKTTVSINLGIALAR